MQKIEDVGKLGYRKRGKINEGNLYDEGHLKYIRRSLNYFGTFKPIFRNICDTLYLHTECFTISHPVLLTNELVGFQVISQNNFTIVCHL